MKVLLSIKPEYVDEIFKGTKKYEYRKNIFKNKNVKKIMVYATKPLGKVVGEFSIGKVIHDTPENIWTKTYKYSGISKEFFDSYFSKKDFGFAIQIKEINLYDEAKDITEFNIKQAPQSFRYVENY